MSWYLNVGKKTSEEGGGGGGMVVPLMVSRGQQTPPQSSAWPTKNPSTTTKKPKGISKPTLILSLPTKETDACLYVNASRQHERFYVTSLKISRLSQFGFL